MSKKKYNKKAILEGPRANKLFKKKSLKGKKNPYRSGTQWSTSRSSRRSEKKSAKRYKKITGHYERII